MGKRRYELARPVLAADPGLAERVATGTLPLLVARAELERRAALAQLTAGPTVELPAERVAVWQGDAFQLADRLPDGSVDLILTDPPWGGAALDVWPRLGQLAARVLAPAGVAIVYVGHLHLPVALGGLAAGGLDWWWAATIAFHGAHPAVRARRVRTRWRPVAILRQPGSRSETPWFVDLFVTDPKPEKRFHAWGQSLGSARSLIERFSLPRQLVFDPFTGAGTFGVAAIETGRRFLGIERDPPTAEIARSRIARALAEWEEPADAG